MPLVKERFNGLIRAFKLTCINIVHSYTCIYTYTVPPQITVPPRNLTVLENTFLSSPPSCQAVGEPVPTYSWFRPDGTLVPIVRGVLQFGILTRSDSGTYTCVATNSAGQVRADFNILVEGTN